MNKEFRVIRHYWKDCEGLPLSEYRIEYRGFLGLWRPVREYFYMDGWSTRSYPSKKEACVWIERQAVPIPEDEVIGC